MFPVICLPPQNEPALPSIRQIKSSVLSSERHISFGFVYMSCYSRYRNALFFSFQIVYSSSPKTQRHRITIPIRPQGLNRHFPLQLVLSLKTIHFGFFPKRITKKTEKCGGRQPYRERRRHNVCSL